MKNRKLYTCRDDGCRTQSTEFEQKLKLDLTVKKIYDLLSLLHTVLFTIGLVVKPAANGLYIHVQTSSPSTRGVKSDLTVPITALQGKGGKK